MIYILSGILAAIAYSSDSIFGKIALSGMPIYIYFIFVSFIYSIIGMILAIIHKKEIFEYIKTPSNLYFIQFAILAVVIGTIIGDFLMFYTIDKSTKTNLPIAICLIHLAPIFSLFLVYFFFKKSLNLKAIFGIFLVFIGTLIAIFNST